MTLYPVFIDDEVSVAEVTRIFHDAGYHLRFDGAGRLVASRVPQWLRPDPPSNVRALNTRVRKVRA